MYGVSEAYKKAMKEPVQHFRLRGTIKNKNMVYPFTQDNILKGSFSVSNQCCGSSAMEIGSVYMGELSMTLLKGVVPRYSIYGATVEPFFSLLTGEGWEEIPLGIFIISEANYSTSGCEITAYDRMSLFDKGLNITTTAADMWTMLQNVSEACGVAIGMDESEVRSFPNGDRMLGIYANNDMETWRDMVSWLAQTAGRFATVNRAGELVFRAFTREVTDNIDAAHRFTGCKFSDFETRYTGLSVVNIGDQTTSYYGALDVEDDGLTMNLGSNPFLQYGVDETVEASRRAVLEAIEEIRYVPFSASMIGNPAYDLGDVFRFSGGIADGDCISCMTKYDWKYNDKFTMEGVGENPALANARSKVDKDITGLLSNTDENRMYYYTFTNSDLIRIKSDDKKPVISLVFAAVKNAELEFKAEILCETEADDDAQPTVVMATYMFNGEEIHTYLPTETLQDGKHILHLFYPLTASAGTVNRWVVSLSAKQGTLKIDKGQILAMISGQGLAGKDGWDGTIDVSDEVEFDLITMRPRFAGNVAITTPSENRPGLSDSVRLNLASFFASFSNSAGSEAGINVLYVEDVLDADDAGQMEYSHRYVNVSADGFVLNRDYDYYSTEQSIDEGRMCVAEADTDNFASVEELSVTSSLMKYTEYINPNKSRLGFTLSNWIYDTSDRFELVFKMNSNPNTGGNWPQLLGTANSSSAKLLLQFNLWNGRNVMNIAYNGTWSGDGNMSYSSPYDYDNYYRLAGNAGTVVMYRGAAIDDISTPVFTKSYPDGSGSSDLPIKLFCNVASTGLLDMNLYGIKVWDNEDNLIHDYSPIIDGLYDKVGEVSFMAATSGHINGPEKAEADGAFLIGDAGGKIYTIVDDELQEIPDAEMTSALFSDYGIVGEPDGEYLLGLDNPKVYLWKPAGEGSMWVRIAALETPKPQAVITENVHLSHPTIVGVENVTIDADDNTLFAVSFDDGITWWNYVNDTWAALSESLSGQTKESIEAISTNAWAQKVAGGGTIKFRFVISGNGYVDNITIHYLN